MRTKAQDKFTQEELQRWNSDPGSLSLQEISRLICYVNDTWYVYEED